MADLTTNVHGKSTKFENVPVSEVDNLIAAIPRKEKEMPYEEVVAYITKKYSSTGKRPKKPEVAQTLSFEEKPVDKKAQLKIAPRPAPKKKPKQKVYSAKKPARPPKVLWEGSVFK
jgi:hypothetical protein